VVPSGPFSSLACLRHVVKDSTGTGGMPGVKRHTTLWCPHAQTAGVNKAN
jgi:hypothetical protein